MFTCSKLTIETLEQGKKYVQIWQQRHQNDDIGVVLMFVNFKHILHIVLVFLLLTLNM